MMDDENFFGLKLDLDASGFLKGARDTERTLDDVVRSIAEGTRKASADLQDMAERLSLTPREVQDALKQLGDAQREQEREMERMAQAQMRRQAEQERQQIEMIRSRTEAVSRLRDVMLSVAAISIGGHGLSGINSLLQETSQRGVSEATFAERTGTNVRRNVAEEEGAYLSGMSSRDEARQSIAAYANAQAEYQRTGQSGLTTSLLHAGVQLSPAQLRMNHADFVSYVVGQLHHLGYNNQLTASVLEQSGLTSGGYTNLALHPDQMRYFNQMGDRRAQGIASNQERDLEFQQSWRHMVETLSTMRDDISHDLEPWVKELDHFAQEIDDYAKKNPETVRQITEAAAVAVALGGLVSALMPLVGTLLAARAIVGAGGAVAGIAARGAGSVIGSVIPRVASVALGAPAIAAYLGLTLGKAGLSSHDTISPDQRGIPSATKSEHFSDFAASVAGIEGAQYGQMGGAGGKYAGKYQMSQAAIQDAAHWLHERAPTQAQFLADPDMQERYFKAYTASNEAIIASKSAQFRGMTADQRLAVLAYAHNQGAGGALNWMKTGTVGHDAFGTDGTRYSSAFIQRALQHRLDVGTRLTPGSLGQIAHGPVSNVTTTNAGTTLNVQHMTVKADNPQQIATAARQSAMMPNGHAMATNSGMH